MQRDDTPVRMRSSMLSVMLGGTASYRSDEFIDPDLDPLAMQPAHWIYSARLSIRDIDDGWGVELSGKNLSNEIVKTFAFDVPLAMGAHMAQTNQPRNFQFKAWAAF